VNGVGDPATGIQQIVDLPSTIMFRLGLAY
jgi:hypothetical protein